MRSLRRALGATALSVWLSACSGETPQLTPCATSAECPVAARCTQRVCVADAPPTARVTVAGILEANELVTLDGAGSSDDDAPDDAITSYAWAVRSAGAGCEAPAVASTGAVAQVRFPCAGRWEVELVVRDEMGVASLPAIAEANVAPRSGAENVAAGEDVSVPHVCDGEPLRCRPATAGGAVALAATSRIMDGVGFAWTVAPPADRPLTEARRVVFVPGPDVPSPTVLVETDGAAISGDWIFRVEARDAAGLVGRASTRVSIENEPPVVVETLPTIGHLYDAAARVFTATGTIPVLVSDPDGDPVEVLPPVWHHLGDGEGTFSGQLLEDAVSYSVVVHHTQPSDAAFLIGGAGLERSIAFAARDANGAETRETWPIVVENRPPDRLWSPLGTLSVPHVYDPAAAEYQASVALSTWEDPEGDPLVQGGATGDPQCAELDVVGGIAQLRCRMALPASGPAVGLFAGLHVVTEYVRDPWSVAPEVPEGRLTILNSKPQLASASLDLGAVACGTGSGCCLEDPDPQSHECIVFQNAFPAASGSFAELAFDADGDPVEALFAAGPVSATPDVGVCPGCTFTIMAPPTAACADTVQSSVNVMLDDGSGAVAAPLTARRRCGP